MLNFNKILLPVDLQGSSKLVVHQAAVLARHFHSEIVILHVVTPLSYAAGTLEGSYVPASLDDLLKELIRQAQKELDRTLAPELDGLPVKRMLLEGDPASTIVRVARDEKANLIVMPTHGYGAFRRFLLGSVTAKVLHDSECPIWTGAHLEEAPTSEFSIRNILCAIDLSQHSFNTVRWAAQLAAEFETKLTLGHITAGVDAYGPEGHQFGPKWKEALVNSATQRITKLQEETNTKAEIFIDSGDVPTLLGRQAKEGKADLLVVGRPSHGRLRATGYGIIRESPIPVLSV
jgi:nucleotide-binding universal stress UspA family protein